jgi:membrane protein implicated in regulation of membrane protease activity
MLVVVALLLLLALHVLPDWGAALVAAAIAVELVEKTVLVWYTRRLPLAAGVETMVGRVVTVVAPCRPAGRVRFGDESWKARCPEGAGIGERLVIDQIDHITLLVRRPS